jgi:GntR family transcriptional regulator/MocR family aminotransferase
MRREKIQLKGQLSIDRRRLEPLSLQIVRQIQEAVGRGRLVQGTELPSTRSLARTLGISRNTVLTAYDELKARGLIRGRRGAAMHVSGGGMSGFDMRRVMRDAQYPSRTISLSDPDGNLISVRY